MKTQLIASAVFFVVMAFFVTAAFSQVNSATMSLYDARVLEAGFTINHEAAAALTLNAGLADLVYTHGFNNNEPTEVDLEYSRTLAVFGKVTVDGYAAEYLINSNGSFSGNQELGLTGSYQLRQELSAGLYLAKAWGSISEQGVLAKAFAVGEFSRSDAVLHTGWKALMCYNHHYYLDRKGLSHAQFQVWASLPLKDRFTLRAAAGKQLAFLDEFESPAWTSLSVTYTN